jgi:hypothetical protein
MSTPDTELRTVGRFTVKTAAPLTPSTYYIPTPPSPSLLTPYIPPESKYHTIDDIMTILRDNTLNNDKKKVIFKKKRLTREVTNEIFLNFKKNLLTKSQAKLILYNVKEVSNYQITAWNRIEHWAWGGGKYVRSSKKSKQSIKKYKSKKPRRTRKFI